MSVVNFSNIADIKKHWINDIAPNYFDFEDTNNYQVGIFGYINEIMANTTEDIFTSVSLTRKEFYPISAENISSLYKLAACYNLDLPLYKAGRAKAVLLIRVADILSSTVFDDGGSGTCVLDNTVKIMADNVPFLLDYPIKIITKKTGSGLNASYIYTCRYDTSEINSLAESDSDSYLVNKVISENGEDFLLIGVTLRQLALETVSMTITKESNIDTITVDIPFEGNLAGFDKFYQKN